MNIDEFLVLARKRRSIRRFKPDPVPDEYIDKILDAARWAMSGANGQPWEFIVVKDPETKNKLAEAKMEQRQQTVALESSRMPIGYPAYESKIPHRRELKEIVHHDKYDMSKYRSHEDVQEFIRKLRELSKPV